MVLEKRHILLIDQEQDKCETFLAALESMPSMFKYSFAYETKDAIRQIKKTTPDFIFLDICSTNEDSLLCLEAIKKVKPIRHIPCYVYSAHLNQDIEKRAAQLGALKCVKKPKDARTLAKLFKLLFFESARMEVRNFAPRKNE